MNALDVILLAVMVYAAARGFRQGALAQVAVFGGAAVGLVAGGWFAPDLAALFIEGPGSTLAMVTLGLLLTAVLLGQLLGVAIGSRLRAAARSLGIAPVDRTAGIAVGITGVLLAAWLLAAALSQGPVPAIAQQVRGSQLIGAVGEALPPPPDVFGRVGAYLDQQGFPQVFAGLGSGAISPPVDPPADGDVAAAAEAGTPGTVQVQATGCGGVSFGSGFVTSPGFVVTNAHVVAGGEILAVRDTAGAHDAVAVFVDSDLDLAVLQVSGSNAPVLAWASEPAQREASGATLGFPGGQAEMMAKPARVRSRSSAVGRDIYGRGSVTRDILTLSAPVRRGDSGGPFVTSAGEVAGVVFAASAAEPGTGYALTAESVRPIVAEAVSGNSEVPTGACRF